MLLTFPFGSYTDLMLPQSKKVSGLNPFLARIASWNCLRLISSEKVGLISTQTIDIIYKILLRNNRLVIKLFQLICTVLFNLIILTPSCPSKKVDF